MKKRIVCLILLLGTLVLSLASCFRMPEPLPSDFVEGDEITFTAKCLNPASLEVLTGCKVGASLAEAKAPASYQFMRLGYFCPDSRDCAPGHLVFNRSVSLKDSFKPGK